VKGEKILDITRDIFNSKNRWQMAGSQQ